MQIRDDFDPVVIPLYSEQTANLSEKGYRGSASVLNLTKNRFIKTHMIPRETYTPSHMPTQFIPHFEEIPPVLKRRLTHPLSFRRRQERPRKMVSETNLTQSKPDDAEVIYKKFPNSFNEKYQFSETYSFPPLRALTIEKSDDTPIHEFAKSTRFDDSFNPRK
jgi:hypothetical protein